MNRPTFACLFSGAGGASQGALQADLEPVWGIEWKKAPAQIARRNGFYVIESDVRDINWRALRSPDVLQVSPPCQNASKANMKGGETTEDRSLALCIIKAIAELEPTVFILENVLGYQQFQSFQWIEETLRKLNYQFVSGVLNAASYGVAQSRKRLFLVATRITAPLWPSHTHTVEVGFNLFSLPRVGWQEAIAHAAEPPQLKPLSARMTKQLPAYSFQNMLVSGWKDFTKSRPLTMRTADDLSPTIIASMKQPSCRPWIISKEDTGVIRSQVLDYKHLALLQGFHKDYKWTGSNGSVTPATYEAIGNAVPPILIQKIIEANYSALNNSLPNNLVEVAA